MSVLPSVSALSISRRACSNVVDAVSFCFGVLGLIRIRSGSNLGLLSSQGQLARPDEHVGQTLLLRWFQHISFGGKPGDPAKKLLSGLSGLSVMQIFGGRRF